MNKIITVSRFRGKTASLFVTTQSPEGGRLGWGDSEWDIKLFISIAPHPPLSAREREFPDEN